LVVEDLEELFEDFNLLLSQFYVILILSFKLQRKDTDQKLSINNDQLFPNLY
jgi:hypothetical protein